MFWIEIDKQKKTIRIWEKIWTNSKVRSIEPFLLGQVAGCEIPLQWSSHFQLLLIYLIFEGWIVWLWATARLVLQGMVFSRASYNLINNVFPGQEQTSWVNCNQVSFHGLNVILFFIRIGKINNSETKLTYFVDNLFYVSASNACSNVWLIYVYKLNQRTIYGAPRCHLYSREERESLMCTTNFRNFWNFMPLFIYFKRSTYIW